MNRLFWLPIIMSVLLFGCKDINEAPKESESSTFRMELAGLQQQLGYNAVQSKSIQAAADNSDITGSIKSVVIGAMVVTKRATPYTPDLALATSMRNDIKEDIINSASYFEVVHFPTTAEYVEFKVPPAGAGDWQIVAIASSKEYAHVGELDEADMINSILYYGFNGQFYKAEDIGNDPVDIIMKRACLIDNPPIGCAAYDEFKTPIVTSSVEIIDVQINGVSVADKAVFPVIVRNTNDESYLQQKSPSKAISFLKVLINGQDSISELLVRTTHASNATESAACKALADVKPLTVAQLEAACEIQENRIYY